MKDQPTSNSTDESTVSEGLAIHLARMTEDATRKYPGGTKKAELAKSHPEFVKRLWNLWDDLATEQALRLPIIERDPWKTIKLGTGPKTANDFIKAIKDSNGNVSTWAEDMLDRDAFRVSDDLIKLDLFILTPAELGFPNGAKIKDVYEKARAFGLSLCPAEVGPQLRLQYPDQPINERLIIAMEPITVFVGDQYVYQVEHVKGCWLDTRHVDYGDPLFSHSCWVFCRCLHF